MAKIDSNILISDLIQKTEFCIKGGKKLLKLKEDKLNDRTNPETWSSLQCLDHLNQYGDFYLNEIRMAMDSSSTPFNPYFSPGFIGNMFAKSMVAKSGMTKMQSPSDMVPTLSPLTKEVVNTFLNQQKEYLALLQLAKSKNLNKIKIKVTISKWVKLKLGDALRVTVLHNERHVIQALRASKLN
ncbi:MAG: DinB family protein [Salibacteraceae bacterium]